MGRPARLRRARNTPQHGSQTDCGHLPDLSTEGPAPLALRWPGCVTSPTVTQPVLRRSAVLADTHDEWQVSDRRYLSEASMAQLDMTSKLNPPLQSPAAREHQEHP